MIYSTKVDTVKSYKLCVESLDPITVHIRMDSDTAGRITIECYSQCWTSYWGSMGSDMANFWKRCDVDYLTKNLECKMLTNSAVRDREYDYLKRIVTVVKKAFEQNLIG